MYMFSLALWVISHVGMLYPCDYLMIENSETWLVQASSSITVDGKTNINSFSCVVSSYGKIDTLQCDTEKNSYDHYRINSTLEVPVVNFDCHHKIMTKDLQKTLKAKEFPMLLIDIRYLSKLPRQTVGSISTGDVMITIAGVNRRYNITFSGKNHQNQIELVGNKTILFSDFGLKPPSKLGGAIKVKNELDVEVKLHLQKY